MRRRFDIYIRDNWGHDAPGFRTASAGDGEARLEATPQGNDTRR
jgi:hypothetical protein